jgi:hypothetical protein
VLGRDRHAGGEASLRVGARSIRIRPHAVDHASGSADSLNRDALMTDPTDIHGPDPDAIAAAHDDAAARLASDPTDVKALIDRAQACLGLGASGVGLALLERAADLATPHGSVLLAIAQAQFGLGLLDAVLETTTKIIGHAPPEITNPARQLRVQSLLRTDRLDQAATEVAAFIREGGGASALGMLASIEEARGDREQARARLRPLVANTSLPASQRMGLAYELARITDRLGGHDEAFEIATLAGTLVETPFDLAAFESETEALIRTFAPDRVGTLPRGTRTDERPIFIVGMPRSGTTLLEQIICAHPDAAGVQERYELEMHAQLLMHRSGTDLPTAIERTDSATLDEFADEYLAMLGDVVRRTHAAEGSSSSEPIRVVNKALKLDRLCGLVSRMLPRARIIVIRRNPLDNLVSIRLNPMSPSAMPWSTSLEGLIAARRRFDRLTAHWKAVLDVPVFDLDYESLVAAPELHIRALLQFLDLPFDERCLSFHSTGRTVMTPSRDQVNKPMNTSAVERWRRYERHLGPLLEAFPPSTD